MDEEVKYVIVVCRDLLDLVLCGGELRPGATGAKCKGCHTSLVVTAESEERIAALAAKGYTAIILCHRCGRSAVEHVPVRARVEIQYSDTAKEAMRRSPKARDDFAEFMTHIKKGKRP